MSQSLLSLVASCVYLFVQIIILIWLFYPRIQGFGKIEVNGGLKSKLKIPTLNYDWTGHERLAALEYLVNDIQEVSGCKNFVLYIQINVATPREKLWVFASEWATEPGEWEGQLRVKVEFLDMHVLER
ncbi:hypothetical protein RUND412_004897 [Rhizina undulata]